MAERGRRGDRQAARQPKPGRPNGRQPGKSTGKSAGKQGTRPLRQVQRVAAYAVIVRDGRILLSRLAGRVTHRELWTLPGGGVEHGEDPRDAVVREVREETGLAVSIAETAHVYSLHQHDTWRHGRRADAHAMRIVFEGWVPPDSPAPRTVEVDGSTAEAAWQPLADVLDGSLPTVSLVTEALTQHRAARVQRVSVRALVVRDDRILLARNSALDRYAGEWALPGGGIEHGETPRDALTREMLEETGLRCRVGEVVDVSDTHFEGTAPSGRREDYHGVQIVFDVEVDDGVDDGTAGDRTGPEPRVVEEHGTTDAVAWVPLAELDSPAYPVRDHVRSALAARARRTAPGG